MDSVPQRQTRSARTLDEGSVFGTQSSLAKGRHPAEDCLPAWSPDGSHILFLSDRDGNSEVYVMDADGSGQADLTNDPAEDGDPRWSPR